MAIYFDYTTLARWTGNPTGISRVVQLIGAELAKLDGDVVPVGFSEREELRYYDPSSKSMGGSVCLSRNDIIFSAGANWDVPGLNDCLRRVREEGVRVSILFYDTIPDKFPYFYGPGFPDIYRAWLRDTLSLADFSFSISENTKRDVIEFAERSGLRVPAIKVIRLGDEIHRSDTESMALRSDISNLDKYVLSVGTVECRKNHIVLLNAYRLLASEGKCDLPKLVIVGREGWLDYSIKFQVENDPAVAGKIFVMSDISDSELDYLYKNALFTVYPALYEGWGLPVAESLRYGKQCITSSTSSMMEIAPGLTRFAHPLKVEQWARQIEELYLNSTQLSEETARVVAGYRGTSWMQSAQQVLAGLRSDKMVFNG
ncbi:glycosyltransferase family 4 protein [Burkholderia multivorans]|uniref:glycosyltransferase family 4 protein n=1 Tax=Burkholderia multivorans TaxID=87883 RepID=UPI0020B43253|nr:glycosyltransferase family 1 protein [Burkholderia multivorans]